MSYCHAPIQAELGRVLSLTFRWMQSDPCASMSVVCCGSRAGSNTCATVSRRTWSRRHASRAGGFLCVAQQLLRDLCVFWSPPPSRVADPLARSCPRSPCLRRTAPSGPARHPNAGNAGTGWPCSPDRSRGRSTKVTRARST